MPACNSHYRIKDESLLCFVVRLAFLLLFLPARSSYIDKNVHNYYPGKDTHGSTLAILYQYKAWYAPCLRMDRASFPINSTGLVFRLTAEFLRSFVEKQMVVKDFCDWPKMQKKIKCLGSFHD